MYLYDIESGTPQNKRIGGWVFTSVTGIQLTSDRIYRRETGGLLPNTTGTPVGAPLPTVTTRCQWRPVR